MFYLFIYIYIYNAYVIVFWNTAEIVRLKSRMR